MILRKIAGVSSATIIGQSFQLASILLLARVLSPEDFGPYAMFMAVLALTSGAGSAKYELAFGLVSKRAEVGAVLVVSAVVATAIGLVAALLTYYFIDAAVSMSAFTWISFWSPVLMSVMVGAGTVSLIFGEVLPYLCYRLGLHSSVATYALLRPSLIGLVQISLVATETMSGDKALLVGAVAGQSVALIAYFSSIVRSIGPIREKDFRGEVYRIVRTYAYLTRTQAPQQLLSRLSLNSLPIVFTAAFGAAVGGWYVIANRVLCTPSQLFGKTLRGVFFSEGCRLAREYAVGLRAFHGRMTVYLFVLSGLYFVPVALFSEWLVQTVFGDQWVGAAPILSVLAIFWWSAVSNIPSTSLVSPLNLDVWYVRYETLLFGFRGLALLIGAILDNPLSLAWGFSIVGVLFNGTLIMKVRSRIGEIAKS